MKHKGSEIGVARNIAKLRRKRGWTQADLAAKLYISNKTVSKWERGAGYPELNQLLRMSDLFGVTMDALIRGERYGIAIAGSIVTDEIKIIETFPEQGMLTNITSMSRAVGGCVPNTLISLAKIDQALALSAIGRRGDDEAGRYVVDEMARLGIDVSGVQLSRTSPTGFSDVMTVKDTGARTFFYNGGANREFCPADVQLNMLNCRMLHIGYIHLLDVFDAPDDEYGTVMARFLKEVQESGIKTSVDVVSQIDERFAQLVLSALPYIDNLILNEVEACGVSGLPARDEKGNLIVENIRSTMDFLLSNGVSERVIVHCPEAGFCYDYNREFITVPSLQLPKGYIKGTVGAGDAFCAGCLYGIYHRFSNEEILRFASGAAACNLAAEDSVSGMQSSTHIRELIETYAV